MKHTLFLALLFIASISYSQSGDFETLLEAGKSEFLKSYDAQNFEIAVKKLEQAVELKPKHAEARYFLGYAYSRLNSKDGKSMIDMNLDLTLKASEQFEIVNKLSPKYEGEKLVLDPYSKLTAEWGSLAMSFWHKNKPDSAIWAFKEGRQRGGFSDFYLSINRKVLDLCTQNAVLISSGDNFTFPLWYLQLVEEYRTDVMVIDVTLLNTLWYPRYLVKQSGISFGIPLNQMNSIQYCQWKDSVISFETVDKNVFSWTVKPSLNGRYLIRGNQLLLNFLKANQFKRDVYFTTAFPENAKLSLNEQLTDKLLVDKINHENKEALSLKEYEKILVDVAGCIDKLNQNSTQELSFIDMIRYDVFNRILYSLNNGDKEQAKAIMDNLNENIDATTYPFQSERLKEYHLYLQDEISTQ